MDIQAAWPGGASPSFNDGRQHSSMWIWARVFGTHVGEPRRWSSGHGIAEGGGSIDGCAGHERHGWDGPEWGASGVGEGEGQYTWWVYDRGLLVLEEGGVRGTVARSVREATVVASQLGKGVVGVNGPRGFGPN